MFTLWTYCKSKDIHKGFKTDHQIGEKQGNPSCGLFGRYFDYCIIQRTDDSTCVLPNFHPTKAGFTINREKSSLIPSQVADYLGFQINSRTMSLKLPRHKIKDLITECKKIKTKQVLPVRKLASLIGKITATVNAIFPA